MASSIQEEQAKYDQFLEELSKYSGDASTAGAAAQDHATAMVQQYMHELSVGAVSGALRNWQAETPEEIETLELCFKVWTTQRSKKSILTYSSVGLLATSFVNIVYSEYFSGRQKTLAAVAGVVLGAIYGTVRSNKENMRTWSDLGPDYQLGRIAHEEEMQWMDPDPNPAAEDAPKALSQELCRLDLVDIQSISSLAEMATLLRADPTLARQSTFESTYYRLFFKAFGLMKREFEKDEPDFSSLVSVFEQYSQCGALPSHTWDSEVLLLFKKMRTIATRKHSELSTEDFATLSWRVQKAGISLDLATLRDLLMRVETSPSIDAETLLRVVEIFASQKLYPKDFFSHVFLPSFKAVPKTQDQALRLLVCMCQFGEIANNEMWRSAVAEIYPLQPLSAEELRKINILRYILTLEQSNLLYARINAAATVSSLLNVPQCLEPVVRTEPKSSISSTLHNEVKYVMDKHPLYKDFKENVNIGNAFIVDFANVEAKMCVDVDAVTHYFRPQMGSSYMEGKHSLLIGFIHMKYRALERDGWKVLQVPFYEWQNFLDEEEKTIYMTRKMNRYSSLFLKRFKNFS